jgi:hypothetical protein
MDLPIRFSCPDSSDAAWASGNVVDISSRGFAFRTGAPPLPPGTKLNAYLGWPARLDNRCMLQLFVEGVVIRSGGSLVVGSIRNYEFRTVGRPAAADARDGAPAQETSGQRK